MVNLVLDDETVLIVDAASRGDLVDIDGEKYVVDRVEHQRASEFGPKTKGRTFAHLIKREKLSERLREHVAQKSESGETAKRVLESLRDELGLWSGDDIVESIRRLVKAAGEK
jgi:hypothetical protein